MFGCSGGCWKSVGGSAGGGDGVCSMEDATVAYDLLVVLACVELGGSRQFGDDVVVMVSMGSSEIGILFDLDVSLGLLIMTICGESGIDG